jgi:hypothetical protein
MHREGRLRIEAIELSTRCRLAHFTINPFPTVFTVVCLTFLASSTTGRGFI